MKLNNEQKKALKFGIGKLLVLFFAIPAMYVIYMLLTALPMVMHVIEFVFKRLTGAL